MSRVLMFVVWILMVLSVLTGLHYFLWSRLVRGTQLPAPWRWVVTAAIVALALSIPLAFGVSRALSTGWREVVVWPAFVWMGLMFLLFVFLGVPGLARWSSNLVVGWTTGSPLEVDSARRLLVSRLLAGGAAAVSFGLGGVALVNARSAPRLKRLTVRLSRLPAALSGLSVVQISDLHAGDTIGREYVAEVVRMANQQSPDLVVITGDLVDGSTAQLRNIVAPLAELRARFGVFFVTGNHEYYSGVEAWLAFLPRMGIRVLRNERVSIGENGATFDLAGVDDSSARGLAEGHGADVDRALAGRDPTREVILLAHQPKEVHGAAAHDVGLVLSGHTHGGQIWPFGYLVALTQPYLAGWAQHGPTQIYVSRGTGYWGPPMRLGTYSELTVIELRATDKGADVALRDRAT